MDRHILYLSLFGYQGVYECPYFKAIARQNLESTLNQENYDGTADVRVSPC